MPVVLPRTAPVAAATPPTEYRPGTPPPAPAPVPFTVTVDNSYVLALIQKQQDQIDALAQRIDSAILELADAVRKLEPGRGFTVSITDWTSQGRIKTLKINKE